MSEIGDELRENAKLLRVKAHEAEEQWRAAHGLSKDLRRETEDWRRRRRRRAKRECPEEPKANVLQRRYRDKQLGRMGAASKVRRIDQRPGEAD
jgi:hypothetical protein